METPGAPRCPGPVPVDGFVNDLVGQRVVAEVDLEAVSDQLAARANGGPTGLVAVQSTGGPGFGLSAGAYSYSGNYATSSLNPSGAWDVGTSSGAFTYSYPIEGMPAPAGAAPTVTAVYNSNLIDGLTSDQNTQGSNLGPGWSMGESFIERTYKTCAAVDDDANIPYEIGDLCYLHVNGTMSIDGMTERLVLLGSSALGAYTVYQFRTEDDSGWRIDHLTKTAAVADDAGGFEDDALDSYWVATDLSGVQYWFGFGKSEGALGDLPGTELHSVWTVPVVSDHPGEPCSTAPSGFCHQPYRWMLDRVVDPNGRVTTYHYGVDLNHYGFAEEAGFTVPYVSGGFLDRVEYGQLATTAGDANVEAARIQLAYSYRCEDDPPTDCSVSPTTATGSQFPDIPVDQFCGLNGFASICTTYSPTFFSLRKLSSVTPQRRTGPGAADWVGPITHQLRYEWKDADLGGTDPSKIFLQEFRRVETSTGTSFSPVRFDSWQSLLENRVDYSRYEGVTPMPLYRIDAVLDPMGRDVRVTYSGRDPGCVGSATNWKQNVKRCYPRWWVPVDNPAGQGFSIWHRYRVERVDVLDGLGISAPMVTTYDYLEPAEDSVLGGIAWHADDNEFATTAGHKEQLTWGESRGYSQVAVTTGAASDPNRSVTTHRTYRGMDQDRLSQTADEPELRSVLLPDGLGGQTPDHDWLRGRPLETWTSNAAGTIQYSGEVVTYVPDWFDVGSFGTAYRVSRAQVFTRTEGGFFGLTSYVYDASRRLINTIEWGDVDSAYANVNGPANSLHPAGMADDRCTIIGHTPTTARFPEGLVNREIRVSGSVCNPATAPILSDTSTSYDGTAFGAAPTAGNPTRVDRAVGNTTSVVAAAGAAAGVATVSTFSSYEPNGYAPTPGWSRTASVTDAAGVAVTTTYASFAGAAALTTAANHNVQTVTTTGPLGAGATTFDTRGLDIATTDVNGRITRACYDVWLRVTEVWMPGETFTACGTGSASMTSAYVATNQTVIGSPLAAFGWQVQSWRIQTRTLMSIPGDPFHPPGAGASPVYIESNAYLDAAGRTVETHTASPAGGRVVTRTVYDSRGLAVRTSEPFAVAGVPGSGRVAAPDPAIPRDNVTTFDPLQRPINMQLFNAGVAVRETISSYVGRSSTVNPAKPVGGAATAAWTTSTVDAYGRLVQVVEPLQTTAATPAITTAYEYTLRDELERIIDTAGVQTSMAYNNLGWRTVLNDPNQGVSTTRYHRTGEIERTVDAKNKAITTLIDTLGRPTAVRNGTTATAPLIADFLYDPTGNKGAVARTRSYWDPDISNGTIASALTSTSTATAFDARGRLTGYTVQINGSSNSADANHNLPSSADDGLFVAYPFTTGYARNDLPWRTVIPAVTGVYSAETVSTRYTTLGLPATVDTTDTAVTAQSDGVRRWVSAVAYDDIGRETGRSPRGIGTVGIDNTVAYQPTDGRTATMTTTINGGTNNGRRIQQDAYTYDAPGNPTRIVHDPDVVANYAGQPSTANELVGLDQSECHYYDARQRLTRSYTPPGATACLAAPGVTVPLGGPTPYTETNSYDPQTRFTTKESRAYSYVNPVGQNAPVDPTGCAPGTQTRPHAVRAITGGTPPVEWFGYDCNGSMISRRADPGTGQQVVDTYGWDVRNRLQTVTRAAGTTTNIYDTTGQRILRREPDGRRTIYLGSLEIRHQAGQVIRGTKHPAAGITIDFDQTRSYTTHNHQASITDNTTPTATTPTRYRPYGAVRDGNPIAERSFLNQHDDPDPGLNYLTNRHYNSATGVFISVDPIARPGVPGSLNPYTYARGHPITLSDPTGLEPGCGTTAYSATSCREAHAAADRAYADRIDARNASGTTVTNGSLPGPTLGGFKYSSTFEGYLPWYFDAQGNISESFDVYHGCYLSMGTELLCEGGKLPEFALVGFVDSGEDAVLESGPGAVFRRVVQGARLFSYGSRSGGHHILAKSLFFGDDAYSASRALSIPNDELQRLGIRHTKITANQQALYRGFAQSGSVLTLEGAAEIEIKALVNQVSLGRSPSQSFAQRSMTSSRWE